MTELLHLTRRADWMAAQTAGQYRVSTRGRTLEQEGFIHCSLRGQLRGVAETFYAGDDDLVVLMIDSDRLDAPVRYEAPAPGAPQYPHIYGPVPLAAVTAVVEVTRDPAGRLVLPG